MVNRAGVVAIVLFLSRIVAAQPLPIFEFKDAKAAGEWKGSGDVAELKVTEEGLEIVAKGPDPFIMGPARDYPANQLLSLRMRIKSEEGGELQVFYYTRGASEQDSVKVDVIPGDWQDVQILLPALGKGYRLRIDPPGHRGTTTLARMAFEAREVIVPPEWEKPTSSPLKDPLELRSDELTLRHSRTRLGEFELYSGAERTGTGGGWGKIGYMIDGKQRWVGLERASVEAELAIGGARVSIHGKLADEDGGNWVIEQTFGRAKHNSIDVRVSVWCDKERSVIFLPMLFVFAGTDLDGPRKTAAIFPGLEYLDKDEPSSSEKDIEGPAARRWVPYQHKITVPLMSVLTRSFFVGLMWKPSSSIAAVFDSPDRLFKSGGHVMGLFYPASTPSIREENQLMPLRPVMLGAQSPVTLSAALMGGQEIDVAKQVNTWIEHNELPAMPKVGALNEYVRLAAAGWLDSKITEDGLYRHAYPGAFNAHAAADAVAMLDWLAARTQDPALLLRLRDAHKLARSRLKEGDVYSSVGHIKTPIAALLYGDANEAAARAAQQGRELLKRFREDGIVPYLQGGSPRVAHTDSSNEASGLSANVVVGVLEAAALSGEEELLKAGLRHLRGLQHYDRTAPRGAQTWEIPLHTPDILAAAHLVRAFTLGYQLTGDTSFLASAKSWANAGLAFVYLRDPTDGGIGPYATIAVFGATNRKAPNWMGQPVQWCGLVYADALYRMAPFLEAGREQDRWMKIADGITASGIQQTWPIGSDLDRQGLLPDSFKLRSQQRVDVCINPATLQVTAARFYRQPPVYSFYVMKNLFVHVPGEIIKTEEAKEALWIKVRPCVKGEYSILVCNLKKQPRVTVNAAPPEKDAMKFVKEGRVVIRLSGEASVLLEDL
jgi:hypothetical protein